MTAPTAPPPAAVLPTAVPPTAVPTASPEPTATRPTPGPPTVIEPVVFNDDFGTSIAPIFADNCASCHNAGGPGAAHWRLEQAADLVETHAWITDAVSTGYMPPWPASDLSLIFHDNRSLRNDEIEAIRAWSGAGAPLDVADTTRISSSTGVVALDADVEIGPLEPFQGSTAVADDYRCLIYELDIDEPRWLSGYEFVPDQTQIVHHAIGYLAPGSVREDAQRLSDEDDLGGWSCYGGSGLRSGDALFLGWAPGQLPTALPDGAGMLVEPGDFIVLQIHYHFDTADAPEDSIDHQARLGRWSGSGRDRDRDLSGPSRDPVYRRRNWAVVRPGCRPGAGVRKVWGPGCSGRFDQSGVSGETRGLRRHDRGDRIINLHHSCEKQPAKSSRCLGISTRSVSRFA